MNASQEWTPRDTTVAGLIVKLQEIVAISPEVAEWNVIMEQVDTDAHNSPWRGTVFQFPDFRELQLETS